MSIIGSEISFIVIIDVFIIFVEVVSKVFINMVEIVILLWMLLNKCFIDFNSCFVSLVFCSIKFININSGIVINMVFFMIDWMW